MKEEGEGLRTIAFLPSSRSSSFLLPSSFFLSLEVDADRQLDPPRIAGRRVLAELGVGLLPGGVENGRRVDCRELHVVERVVQLGAELNAARAAERDVLGERDVPIQIPGPMISSPRRRADAVASPPTAVRCIRWRTHAFGERSPRDRFGSQMMSTRVSTPAPAPPVRSESPVML